MRVIQVVPYIGEEASGPAYTTTTLNRSMRDLGLASQLIALHDAEQGSKNTDAGLLLFPRRNILYRLGRSPEMLRWLEAAVSTNAVDIIHNNSLWMMPNVYPGWVTKKKRVPLIVSPRGTFSKWAMNRSRGVKFLFWHALQKRALAHTALFHATAESEFLDIRRLGFRQPVAIIPNGIDIHPAAEPAATSERTLLFLGRIHPVKGIDLLLQAWSLLQTSFPKWRLRIVGPGDDDYVAHLKKLAIELAAERVEFAGPFYGNKKLEAYREASLFVLPTHSENFGMAVAEALAAGCPVITTKGAPWNGLIGHRAGWWVDIGVEPLRRALEEAMSKTSSELSEMGARGRAWMIRDYSWSQVAEQMIASYRWIKEGGSPPAWIRND